MGLSICGPHRSPQFALRAACLSNARDVRETLSAFCRSFVAPARVIDSPSLTRVGATRRLPARLPRVMSTVRLGPCWSIRMGVSAAVRARGWIAQRGPDTASSVAISMPLPAKARPLWHLYDGTGVGRAESTENVSLVKRALGIGVCEARCGIRPRAGRRRRSRCGRRTSRPAVCAGLRRGYGSGFGGARLPPRRAGPVLRR